MIFHCPTVHYPRQRLVHQPSKRGYYCMQCHRSFTLREAALVPDTGKDFVMLICDYIPNEYRN